MDLSAATVQRYLDLAFVGMERVLDRLDDETVNARPEPWFTNSVAGLVVHCCELAPFWITLPGLGREAVRERDEEFVTEATVADLRDRIADARTRCRALAVEFDAGPTEDHELRGFLTDGDRSDASLVLHVLEELFQHLGHMEVTADALGR